MNSELYKATQEQVVMVAQIIAGMPLEEMLAAISRADAVGPILDPTLYRAASEKMENVARLVSLLQAVKAETVRQITATMAKAGAQATAHAVRAIRAL